MFFFRNFVKYIIRFHNPNPKIVVFLFLGFGVGSQVLIFPDEGLFFCAFEAKGLLGPVERNLNH